MRRFSPTIPGMLHTFRGIVLAVALAVPALANDITPLVAFTGDTGSHPGSDSKGSMILDPNGTTLYGFTSAGGANSAGVMFSYDTASTNYNVLYDFASSATATNGNQPHHGFILQDGGTLYRPPLFGGANSDGTLISIPTTGGAPTLRHTFGGATSNGSQPHSGVMNGGDGNFYGMTAHGGTNDTGVIYSYAPATGTYTTLRSFAAGGGEAHGQLIWNSSQTRLLGMTRYGGTGTGNGNTGGKAPGTIFAYNPNTDHYEVLANFDTTGNTPYFTDHGNLVLGEGDFSTTVFGLTQYGGENDQGALFSMNEAGGGLTLLHSFGAGGDDGTDPFGSLTLEGGWLYGMTRNGGKHGEGTIFRIAQDGSDYEVIGDFHDGASSGSTGKNPIDNVTISADGTMLFGQTEHGGEHGHGTIFSLEIPPPREIPEPGTGSLALGALLVAGLRRRRR